jgi:NAD(P)H dehydrogenase (quinone)
MHSLIISAHPSSIGFAKRIATTYAEEKRKNGHTAALIDLYAPEHKEDYLRFETMADLKQATLDKYQEEIKKCDELVLCFPTWWYSEPAVLKNWIDTHFSAGFAYHFTKIGVPLGHLKGRTLRIFTTTGGPSWVYKFRILPFLPSLRLTLRQCGLRTTSTKIFGPKRHPNEVRDAQWLEEVRTIARAA